MKRINLRALLLSCMLTFVPGCSPAQRVTIGAGAFTPLYGVSPEIVSLPVAKFQLDALPVTNRDFVAFVEAKPNWRPGNVPTLFVDPNYLKHWESRQGRYVPVSTELDAPVTNISWFAASEYCSWRGGKLPTILQWEYVAAASEAKLDASRDPEFVQQLLAWYGRPQATGSLPTVGQRPPNLWGVYDLHGLIWEWVNDFNTVFVGGDNRRDGEQLNNLFCGDSAASSSDRANYAAFMRYALRSSLKGRYTMENLGFRCAY